MPNLQILFGGLFEFVFRAIAEIFGLLIEGIFEFTIKGIANKIYGNRNGGPQTVARWVLYITILASILITLGYMIYGKPFSSGWTFLTAIAGIFSLIIVVIGERR